MARLYVGGLTGAVRPEEIQESFARAGATVEGVELVRDADGRSKGFAYVEVADREGAEKCIKLYNRTAWRGGRLRVEHASESYMERLRREWAERDGLPPPKTLEQAPEEEGKGDDVKEEEVEEGKTPKQERDKRYLRLRRKAGEKALVVDTLPVLLKGADAAALAARGSKSVLKRPRRRAAKLVDFSAGAVGPSAEKSLKEIWDGAFGPMDALLALAAVKPKKKARVQEEPEPEKEEGGGASEEEEGDVAALLEAGEDGELDFAWGDDDDGGGGGGSDGEEEQSSDGLSVEGEEQGEEEDEEASVGAEVNEEMEVEAEEEEQSQERKEEEQEDEELAAQLLEEEERNRRILSGILAGLGPEAGGEGASGEKPVAVARRERPPQALALVPRFDPTSEEAGVLMAVDDEEDDGDGKAAASRKEEKKAGAGVPLDPSAAVAADVGALTDIYRTFRPEEGEEPVPIGAQDSVPFSFGFGLGAGGAAAAPASAGGDALVPSSAAEQEGEDGRDTGATALAAAEEAPVKLLDWRSSEMVSVMWPTLEELEDRARAFVSQRSSAGRGGAGEQAAAAAGTGEGGQQHQRPQHHQHQQQRPRRQPVDEGWRRERHNLSQDFKRKRRNAVKSSRQRQGK